ncbi:hypothetical protein DQ238_20990 [Geodermatophilus sp. TF02-6]|uniref:zinc-binding dehydrogenase n=1 Tax=Geodermatophilus sp. TF02-6 TaxID=2250575 RepID=UPI000DE9A4B1|nr:zinc-binding dehydrogenase [Geodermatophilus sp. TF02-6]RBY74901.1 hypothetical protein DQ238_20990 [Geodermatophilus sp. TF02-6]
MTGACYDRFGGLDVLTVRDDLPEPPVGPDAGQLRVSIARAFGLAQVADAQALVGEGHVRGRVVGTLP